MTYRRMENETDDELIYRVCSDKNIIGTWFDVADILNDLLNVKYTESAYRKKYSAFQRMFEANRSKFIDSEAQMEQLRDEERRLERERIRFRDERAAWNKQNYIAARAEDKLDKLEEALSSIGRVRFPGFDEDIRPFGDSTVLIMLTDLHVGAEFDTFWGIYNSDVAKSRLGQLLSEVKKITDRNKSDECVVCIQGDLISGSIHKSIQVSNRENVIDQVKVATELISSFCYELSKMFSKVTAVGVSGNHSRIDKKDDAMHDDRLDDIVMWAVGLSLSHIPNFKYESEYNIDTSIAMFPIRGKRYIAVHGDYDAFTKQGVSNLITMIHGIPEAVLFGHLHTCAVDECNGIKMVRGGSLAGTGDQLTVEKRLFGKPSQMVCICTEKGIEAYYPVELK